MHLSRPSPAMILAGLALFFALGGTAIAARHYLITSADQIKPSVLKKLRGKAGATGATGKEGPPGREGPQGKEGQPPSALPSGETLRGHYHLELDGTKVEEFGAGYSYAFPLGSTPVAHFIRYGQPPPSACPGTAGYPQAQPGNLCVYEGANHENDYVEIGSESDEFGFGLLMTKESADTERFWSIGSWAVTAP